MCRKAGHRCADKPAPPMPNSRPARPPAPDSTTASPRNSAITWRRPAPSARSRPTSPVRSFTEMVAMVNIPIPPTSSEMAPVRPPPASGREHGAEYLQHLVLGDDGEVFGTVTGNQTRLQLSASSSASASAWYSTSTSIRLTVEHRHRPADQDVYRVVEIKTEQLALGCIVPMIR